MGQCCPNVVVGETPYWKSCERPSDRVSPPCEEVRATGFGCNTRPTDAGGPGLLTVRRDHSPAAPYQRSITGPARAADGEAA